MPSRASTALSTVASPTWTRRPITVASHTSPETFLLPVAAERQVGVVAMKVFGHGTTPDRRAALRYTLGLPGVSLAIVGMDAPTQIDENAALAADLAPLTDEERERLIGAVRPIVQRDAEASKQGRSELFWLHDTTIMGWQERDEPALVAYEPTAGCSLTVRFARSSAPPPGSADDRHRS
jgi:hypothetical protein